MFCGEVCLHTGSIGRGTAAPYGAESTADASHANRHPVSGYVSKTDRPCHEYTAEIGGQAGLYYYQNCVESRCLESHM